MSSREDKDNMVEILLPAGTTKVQKRELVF